MHNIVMIFILITFCIFFIIQMLVNKFQMNLTNRKLTSKKHLHSQPKVQNIPGFTRKTAICLCKHYRCNRNICACKHRNSIHRVQSFLNLKLLYVIVCPLITHLLNKVIFVSQTSFNYSFKEHTLQDTKCLYTKHCFIFMHFNHLKIV